MSVPSAMMIGVKERGRISLDGFPENNCVAKHTVSSRRCFGSVTNQELLLSCGDEMEMIFIKLQ